MIWLGLGALVIGLLVFYIKRSASKAIQLDLREDDIDAAKKASDNRKHVAGLPDDELDELLK